MSTDGAAGLLPLFVWASPAFPVGAFAYSHGLEWAAESGQVCDAASLEAWLSDLLDHGSPRNDAILAAAAYGAADLMAGGAGRDGMRSTPEGGHRAARSGSDSGTAAAPSPSLAKINELALALAGSRERFLETTQQGNAFVLAARAAWPCRALDCLVGAAPADIAYPIAFATAAAGHGLPLRATLETYMLGLLANLVSAGVRLSLVGQTDGQRIIAALVEPVRRLAKAAVVSTLDDLGSAAFRSDLAALQHETQYSRLFRS